jgi:NAD-reducing hydrogenase small subunit
VTLVEGAVSSEEDAQRILQIRARTRILVSFGDCAVTANVPSMRNHFGVDAVLQRVYIENTAVQAQIPQGAVPLLLPRARPVHEFVEVDVFMPGCPPSPDTIYFALCELLAGRRPDFGTRLRFG